MALLYLHNEYSGTLGEMQKGRQMTATYGVKLGAPRRLRGQAASSAPIIQLRMSVCMSGIFGVRCDLDIESSSDSRAEMRPVQWLYKFWRHGDLLGLDTVMWHFWPILPWHLSR